MCYPSKLSRHLFGLLCKLKKNIVWMWALLTNKSYHCLFNSSMLPWWLQNGEWLEKIFFLFPSLYHSVYSIPHSSPSSYLFLLRLTQAVLQVRHGRRSCCRASRQTLAVTLILRTLLPRPVAPWWLIHTSSPSTPSAPSWWVSVSSSSSSYPSSSSSFSVSSFLSFILFFQFFTM